MSLAKRNEQRRVSEYFEQMYEAGVKPWRKHGDVPLLAEFLVLLRRSRTQQKVLDLGCGDGWVSILAARQGFWAWGIDSSSTAIAEAVRSAKEVGVGKRTHFRVGNVLHLPYEDRFFDGFIDRGLFHHILPENRERYLSQIRRVLKPASLGYLSVFSMQNPEGIGQRFRRSEIEDIFGKDFSFLSFVEDPFPSGAPANLLHCILERRKLR